MSRPLGAIALVIHGAAAAVAILLAVLLPYLDLGGGRIALGGGGAPLVPILAICAAVLGLSALLVLYRAVPIFFRLPPYLCWILVLAAVIGVASLIGFWYGFLLEGEFRAWEYTVTGQVALYLFGLISLAALLVVALRIDERPSLSGALERASGWTPWITPLMVFAGSALLSIFLLEGMPHNKDETIYLIQARMYWDGYLTLPAPLYPELWLSQDMVTTQAGHFGRFPVGWPLILGLFDKLTIAWLANPLLAGLLVWLTHRLVRTIVGLEGRHPDRMDPGSHAVALFPGRELLRTYRQRLLAGPVRSLLPGDDRAADHWNCSAVRSRALGRLPHPPAGHALLRNSGRPLGALSADP